MARRGRLWGAERIQGELLKLGITVCKRGQHGSLVRSKKPPLYCHELPDVNDAEARTVVAVACACTRGDLQILVFGSRVEADG